ncbi:Uncharacterised protein [Bordetella pertussis]|nr:Uncharacterised protein [Bordetella pertussis]CFW33980.1 Uncharacterised protein [Bordetella pertussis]
MFSKPWNSSEPSTSCRRCVRISRKAARLATRSRLDEKRPSSASCGQPSDLHR